MTHEQYKNILRITKKKSLITLETLTDKTDRTLLFGRMSNRDQFHVYIKNQELHAIRYNADWIQNKPTPTKIQPQFIQHNQDYIPQIIYPERSDYEFCKKLTESSIELPFKECTDEDFYQNGKHNQFDNTIYYGYTLD